MSDEFSAPMADHPDPAPIQFPHFAAHPRLVHGVFHRRGGVSAPPFNSLNVGAAVGDDRRAVLENRRRILSYFGLSHALYLKQVHGSRILSVKTDRIDRQLIHSRCRPGAAPFAEADGVVTDLPDLALVIQVADCQSVMLADPEKHVVANLHSGWRGSVRNIIGRCLDVMVSGFNCRPERILAGVSPSLGPCCAEFIHYRREIPRHLWPYKAADSDCFDFWALSRDQLIAGGVAPAHIHLSEICTKCESARFFSFRSDRTTGRFATVIGVTAQGRQ